MSPPSATAMQPAKTSVLAPDSQEIRLQELKGKRKPLRERFEDNPNETHLALEIKIIDDQITECNQQIHHTRRSSKS
jgi:hypothetical protein